MKERLDCALISVPGCELLVSSLLSHDRLPNCRLQFSLIEPAPAKAEQDMYPAATFLQDMTYSLRHFDAICLPVSPKSLVWTRILLQQSRIEQHRPIFVLGQALRPIGLIDLLELGVVDFALWPCDPEEIRVRLLRALHQLRGQHARPPSLLGESIGTPQYSVHEPVPARFGGYNVPAGSRLARGYNTCDGSPIPLGPMPRRTQVSSISSISSSGVTDSGMQVSPGRPLPSVSALRHITGAVPQPTSRSALPEVPAICCQDIAQYADGFQQLKSIIVAQFERAYLTQALVRSKGNIALAARNSLKHRRAFWALMRKHQISADPFREYDF